MSLRSDTPRTEQTATKAIVGAVYSGAVAFLGSLGVALADQSVTALEWVAIASATLIATGGAAGLVYYVPNRDKV